MGKDKDRKPHAGIDGAAKGDKKSAAVPPRGDSWRETVESIVVAFILAFLFRTFEAEAFVIPTGSMAPTLYGQHRDIDCAQCGTRFAVGASVGNTGDPEILVDKQGGYVSSSNRANFAVCPNANCRFPNKLLDREIFAGDRILVTKFPYEYADPERFDVVVFKYPHEAKTNYIKRLVGLPGEEVRLENGDVKVRPLDSTEPFRIARKTPEKQRELQILVHDNDHPAGELLAAGWPEAWSPETDSGWSSDAEARSFRVDPDPGDPEQEQWLRYTNYAPSADDWNRVLSGQKIESRPLAQEVRDFYAYNGRITAREADAAVRQQKLPDLPSDNGSRMVGDLTLNCTVEVLAPAGQLILELVEGQRSYRCVFDLATGKGQLEYLPEPGRDDEPFEAIGRSFDTRMSTKGEFDLSFANVDDRLCVWVDDRLVHSLPFDEGSRYAPPRQPVHVSERDKSPVGIAARGANVVVSHLQIERDVFYINEETEDHRQRGGTFKLRDDDDDREDQFLMLGDNSPRSNDGRLWRKESRSADADAAAGWLSEYAVSRRLLIGKAFFIYWPHGVPFMNDGRGYQLPMWSYYERPDPRYPGPNAKVPIPRMSLPFYPQVGRMHRIR